MPESWVKLLFTYGPFAILVFWIWFPLSNARKDMKEAKSKSKTPTVMYVLNWCVVVGLAATSIFVWMKITFGSEAVIRGTLDGLGIGADFSSRFEDLYLRRVDKTPTQAFKWMIVSQQKISGKMVDFLVDRSTQSHEDVTNYTLPIRDDFYQHDVALIYDDSNRTLSEGGVPLKARNKLLLETPATAPATEKLDFHLVPKANAQAADRKVNLNTKTMSQRLEANDTVVRLQARSDLATAGEDAIPYIEQVLRDPDSSYRLKLGALIALNNMPTGNPNLSPEANCSISEATTSADPTLQAEATKYLSTHRNAPLAKRCIQKISNPVRTPPFPAHLRKSRTVYVVGYEEMSENSFQDQAVANLETAIQRWGKLQLSLNPNGVDLIFRVRSFPSEDILTAYDARHWPHGLPVWEMQMRHGLQQKNAPLFEYFAKAFDDAARQ